MDGKTTTIRNPVNILSHLNIIYKETGEIKEFAFDYSYWSHDGFDEEPNGYMTP